MVKTIILVLVHLVGRVEDVMSTLMIAVRPIVAMECVKIKSMDMYATVPRAIMEDNANLKSTNVYLLRVRMAQRVLTWSLVLIAHAHTDGKEISVTST